MSDRCEPLPCVQETSGEQRCGSRGGRCVVAESHSDPGAAAAQEESEESPAVGAGSVLAARQVT